MKPDRWKLLDDLLEAALERPAAERAALLDEACAGDLTLRTEVESLLSADARSSRFVESPAAEIAAQVLDEKDVLAAGQRIGHYQIVSLVGKGGMGAVYLAEDLRLGRRVALKLLPDSFTKDEHRVRRFEQEARAVSCLNHPNILVIHDIGVEDDVHFIATEFIEGETLRNRMARSRISVPEALDLAVQVAGALAEAHQAGIVHRDIKPENVMVRADGLAKVLDFGLAKLTERQPSGINGEALTLAQSNTEPGTILGTVSYMSPEQARGHVVDARSDIFSLGVVLYEMTAGRALFEGETMGDLIASILRDEPTPLTEHSPDIPGEAESIVIRALRKDRDERYQTVRELLGDLKQLKQRLEFEAELARSAPGQATRRRDTQMRGQSVATPPRLPLSESPVFDTASARHTVGRDKERSELRAALGSVSAGRGLMLCVTGEPGIGKTTLVEDFLGELTQARQPCTIARGKCSERLAGTEAYLPLLESLDSLLGSEERDSVSRLMRQLAPHWYDQVVPSSAPASSDSSLAERAAISQAGMKRELGAFCQELAGPRPLVLFFDDLHWADASTIDLLAYLASKFEAMRLLIVVTYRESDLLLAKHPFLQLKRDLQARGMCHETSLRFLSRDEIEKYLMLEFPGHSFPPELALLIHSKTEGNPLFMVDVMGYLRYRNVITEEKGRWVLAQSVPEIERELPESVRAMIERKIAQLKEGDRRLLVAASVQGYEFDSAVVARVMVAGTADVEERLEALDSVHGFVRLAEERTFPDGTLTLTCRFVHVLYQNALYASLRPTRKAQLSAAVVEALLVLYGDKSATVANEIAVLYEAARDFARAADYFRLAAQNASLGFASREAVVLARRGLAMAEMLPEGRERDERKLSLLVALGSSLIATRGYAALEVEDAFFSARALCKSLGRTPHLLPMLVGLWVSSFARGNHRKALEFAHELLGLAERDQDPAIVVGHRMLGCSLLATGELRQAREHLELSVSLYDPAQHRSLTWLYGNEPGMSARSYLGFVLWLFGYPDQGLAQSQEALRLGEQVTPANSEGPALTRVLGYPEEALPQSREALQLGRQVSHANSLGLALTQAAVHHQLRRESQQVRELGRAIATLSAEQGLAFWSTIGTIMHGWAIAEQGRPADGISEMRRGLHAHQSTGMEQNRPYHLSLQAEAHGKAGQPHEGLTVLSEALDLVEKNDERIFEAELHRLRGEMLLMLAVSGQLSVAGGQQSAGKNLESATTSEPEAEECFHRAREIARRQEAKSLELRAVMSLARLWRKQGRNEEARGMLAEIYGWFTEGFDTADLKDAKTLLDELTRPEFSLQAGGFASSVDRLKPELQTPEVQTSPSIAVLPFVNISADPENEYFCDGLAEELINALTKIESLRVVARASAFSFKDKQTDVREIGHKLNVATLLEGSVRRAGDRLRITAQLVNVEDGFHLWSEQYDRPMKDIFDIQDEISLAIVNALKVKLLGAEKAAILKRRTENTEAYQLYLEGRYHFCKLTEQGFRKSIECFEQAIAREPEYALAWAGLAWSSVSLWYYGHVSPNETLPTAKMAAARALALDDSEAKSHIAFAILKLFHDWDWIAGEREFKRALELNPNLSEAHQTYGIALAVIGRSEEAVAEGSRALELDPLSLATNLRVGRILSFAGQYERLLAQGRKLIEMEPNFFGGYELIADESWANGRYEQAASGLQKAVALGVGPWYLAYLGCVYGIAGQRDKTEQILAQFKELSARRYVPNFYLAIVYAGLGDADRAFELLERAYEDREGILVTIKRTAARIPAISKDPRLADLLRRIGVWS